MPCARKKASAAAELQRDDRLAQAVRLARGCGELPRHADRFKEQADHVHFGPVQQQRGDLAGRQVGLIAGADEV
jgi:hypothetical protein